MTVSIVPPEEVPGLEPGINLVESSRVRTTALHQVALGHLDADGWAVWFDVRGNAATYLLNREFRRTPNLEITRAFTSYQHYELVRTLPGDLPRNLDLIVLPDFPLPDANSAAEIGWERGSSKNDEAVREPYQVDDLVRLTFG